MKILIFTAVWKRPEITEICFMGIQRLQKVPGFDVKGFAVISETSMIPLCEKYGVAWCMTENFPVGAKKNYGVKQALRFDFDYLIELGSDDLLKDEALIAYKWDAPVLGLMDFAIVNTSNGESKRIKTTIPKYGAGRAMKRFVIESFEIWNPKVNRGMDNNSTMSLAKSGIMTKGVKSEEPLCVALKSETNIWSYGSLPGGRYSLKKALEGLSVAEIEAIKSLQYASV